MTTAVGGQTPRAQVASAAPLWALAFVPTVWLLHLVACYATAVAWCGRWAGGPYSLGQMLAMHTATGLVVTIAGVAVAVRRPGPPSRAAASDAADTAEARRRFLQTTTLQLATLSAAGMIAVATAGWLAGQCR